jgi:hypothetical protein
MEQSVEWELAGETEVLGENLPLCLPQIPRELTRARTRRLTAWVMALPQLFVFTAHVSESEFVIIENWDLISLSRIKGRVSDVCGF